VPAPEWVWDLVDLAAAQAAGDWAGTEAAFTRLKAAGCERQVEEALLQSYLFLGFPAAIEGFRRWRRHSREPPPATDEGWDLWLERGERVCASVYDGKYEQLRKNIARFHPDLDRWMVVEGYGKVLGRPGLSLDVREMCIVAMLVVQGEGSRRQLRSHLRGALNVGVPAEEVEETIRRAVAFAPPENGTLALKVWSVVQGNR
jgi:4-carboxymuconolactone decarboxylase